MGSKPSKLMLRLKYYQAKLTLYKCRVDYIINEQRLIDNNLVFNIFSFLFDVL